MTRKEIINKLEALISKVYYDTADLRMCLGIIEAIVRGNLVRGLFKLELTYSYKRNFEKALASPGGLSDIRRMLRTMQLEVKERI